MPKVSVILTSFNHARYLREAIDSALRQTFTDFELIIWDDASTDDSWNIINSYSDPRIKAIRNDKNIGPDYGLNKAISEVSSGEYIAIHHSDDMWLPEKLEKQVLLLDSWVSLGAIFTWAQFIDEHGEEKQGDWFDQEQKTRWQWLFQLFTGENHLNHPSALVRKSSYEAVGLYKFGLDQTGDAEMWSRLLLKFDIYLIQEKLTKHRWFSDGSNASGHGIVKSIRTENEWNVIRSNLFESASADDIFKIFPSLGKYYHPSCCMPRFLLSMACVSDCNRPAAWTLGLANLYELITAPSSSAQVKALYGFDDRDLVSLSGDLDPFGFRVVEEYKKNFGELQNGVAERAAQIAETHRPDEVSLSKEQASLQQGNSYAWLLFQRAALEAQVKALDARIRELIAAMDEKTNANAWLLTQRYALEAQVKAFDARIGELTTTMGAQTNANA